MGGRSTIVSCRGWGGVSVLCRSICDELQEQGARERRGRVSVLCHVRECDARNNERVLVLYTMPIESVLLVRFSWRLWRAGSTLVALTLPLTAALSRASPRCPGAGRGLHRRENSATNCVVACAPQDRGEFVFWGPFVCTIGACAVRCTLSFHVGRLPGRSMCLASNDWCSKCRMSNFAERATA